jgi:hypothetical protein
MKTLGTVASGTREVPGAPTIGTATNAGTGRAYNNGAATVTFTAPANVNGLPIISYLVTSSPGGFTGTGASSPVTVTGLQSSTSYTFTVKALNSRGSGTASAASNSITATTVPQAPTIGVATGGNALATVAYIANATGGSAVTTFTATSSPGGFTGTGASPITVSGLTWGTSYTFTVTATNANGTSLPSAASNAAVPFNPYPVVTGGTLTSDATYYYRTFTSNGTLGVSGYAALVTDVLLVAGGGAGGFNYGGGGGAGGLVYATSVSYSSNATITIGAGGTINGINIARGNPGGNSTCTGVTTAIGGGGGGGAIPEYEKDGGVGGSGGGASSYWNGDAVGGAGTAGQGYAGGDESGTRAGGGGGASGPGNVNVGFNGFKGGDGLTYFGTTYAGGGGGGGASAEAYGGPGGAGGGGNGGSQNASGANASFYGGGGGGGGPSQLGPSPYGYAYPGVGYQGICIFRYTRSQVGG